MTRRRADGSEALDWYCRLTGKRLPSPTEPTFWTDLAAARAPKPKFSEGTMGAALDMWLRAPERLGLSKATIAGHVHYTKALSRMGKMPLSVLTRGKILELRDSVAHGSGPAAANRFKVVLHVFLSFCVDRGLLEHNPASRIKPLKGGHFEAWTEDEARLAMAQFLEEERRLVVLAYHTGQRRGDLIKLKWSSIEGGRIRLVQEKTGTALNLPVHPHLQAELSAWERRSVFVLINRVGRPWGPEHASMSIKAEVERLRMRPGLNIHGLRKLAATRLAEAGCSANEIASITGHKTLSMVALYTAAARQEKLADAAFERLSQKPSQNGTNARKVLKFKR